MNAIVEQIKTQLKTDGHRALRVYSIMMGSGIRFSECTARELRNAIDDASLELDMQCWECGQPATGSLITLDWARNMCDACAAKHTGR